MSKYQRALIFAAKAHEGQRRRNGNNYIVHPIRVSQDVVGEDEKIIALLHDILEDTTITFETIEDEFGGDIATCVQLLTNYPGESYEDYIERVIRDDRCIKVKIADISDNLSDSPTSGYIVKAAKAIERLVTKL